MGTSIENRHHKRDIKKISVVMCTYNGEKYVKEQIESILAQTYPIHEIIIQDDNSSDRTVEILTEYINRLGQSTKFTPPIYIIRNQGIRGVNSNFFSAFKKATGDYIAVSDQDDIWLPSKLEKLINAIGDKLMAACRSRAFRENGDLDSFNNKLPNYHLIRMIYTSVAGHNMMFHKNLLEYLPDNLSEHDFYYDSILSLTAATVNSISVVNEILVKFRRHTAATTYTKEDKHLTMGAFNGLYILWWSLIHYGKMRKIRNHYFGRKLKLLENIKFESPLKNTAKNLLLHEAGIKKPVLLGLMKYHYKYHEVLFFSKGKGFIVKIRALLYCFMHLYNYKFLLERERTKNHR